jgi:hypothetical protein
VVASCGECAQTYPATRIGAGYAADPGVIGHGR